ncbi:hypothetical protein AB0O31_10075 [Kitasatospora cineracea]|uniref:hypothetical protein n=1 Tax=Kitasatospora cineracea TaxID=88074 RepID=UPI00343069CF
MAGTTPPDLAAAEAVAERIRTVLCDAARDAARGCDPADLAATRNTLARHLHRKRRLATDLDLEFSAVIAVDLAPDDLAAVERLLGSQREQGIAEALRRQRTAALARELADPAAVLVRWIEQADADWAKLPTPEQAAALAGRFAEHRPDRERSVDFELLEVLREFLAGFAEQSQRQMLCALLASGMRRADRPMHADRVEAIAGDAAPAEP